MRNRYLITYYKDFTNWDSKQEFADLDEEELNDNMSEDFITELKLSSGKIIASNQVISMELIK